MAAIRSLTRVVASDVRRSSSTTSRSEPALLDEPDQRGAFIVFYLLERSAQHGQSIALERGGVIGVWCGTISAPSLAATVA